MRNINQITHNNPLIQSKVNFFADYFNFSTAQIGRSDFLELENPLSLINKVIFQLENNLEFCIPYLNRYFSNKLFDEESKWLKQYLKSEVVVEFISEYTAKIKTKKKLLWIKENLEKLDGLKKVRTDLKRFMFKRSLKSIMVILTCEHDVNEHLDDLIYHTNILVSELYFSGKSKEDIIKVFDKILSKEPSQFPFPPAFLKRNQERLKIAKEEFLAKRTFQKQFEGIYNFYKSEKIQEYFIYRIFNLSAYEDFLFKYDNVTFCHPKHGKVLGLEPLLSKSLMDDFFDNTEMILAIVAVNYSSKNIASLEAKKHILTALDYLNNKCDSFGFLEEHSYLTSSNFKDLGWKWSRKENAYLIAQSDLGNLMNNPFRLLKGMKGECKEVFLKYEHLYVTAQASRKIEDIWHYLETIIPTDDLGNKQVKFVFTKILLHDYIEEEHDTIDNYIRNCLLNVEPEFIGLNRTKIDMISRAQDFDLENWRNEIDHPFLNYLFAYLKTLEPGYKNEEVLNYYRGLISEAYAQRNAILHSGYGNEEALIQMDLALPYVVSRFRRILILEIKKNLDDNLENLVKRITHRNSTDS